MKSGISTALYVAIDLDAGAYATARSLTPILSFDGIAGVNRMPLIAGELPAISPTRRPSPLTGERVTLKRPSQSSAWSTRWRATAQAQPDPSPSLLDYDCGAFERLLETAIRNANVAAFEEHRRGSAERGKLHCIGIASCVQARTRLCLCGVNEVGQHRVAPADVTYFVTVSGP